MKRHGFITADSDWPTGHMAWGFESAAEFEEQATLYLGEGVRRHERLMFVADEPEPGSWAAPLIATGQLVVASTTDVYGAGRIVDAEAQLATFKAALADAISDGHTGIRVAADNSSLVTSADGLHAWMLWEAFADEFMAHHPVTGLCAFDRSRIGSWTLGQLLDVHQTTVSV
jgi:hypothetical protein